MRRSFILWLSLGLAAAIVLGSGYIGWRYWRHQRTFYSDGDSVRLPVSKTIVRDVVWKPGEALTSLNTEADERGPRLSADGLTMVFTRRRAGGDSDIYLATRSNPNQQTWNEPQVLAAVCSPYDELGSELSRDGKSMYFSSNRPGGFGGFDIWIAHKTETGWQEPVNLGSQINTEFNEFSPSLSSAGDYVYFASDRQQPENGADRDSQSSENTELKSSRHRDRDLYRAKRTSDDEFESAEPLRELNSASDDDSPALSPSGDFVYFSSNRPGGHGGFDLYRARILRGQIMEPMNLGAAVNGPQNEFDPAPCLDGFGLHFSSDRNAVTSDQSGGGQSDDLYYTTSREVFTEVDAAQASIDWRALLALLLPILLWALLGLSAAALFVALVKKARTPHISLIARCLLVSLMAHLMLLILMTFWQVTTSIALLMDESGSTRVRITSAVSGQSGDLFAQVRQGVTDVTLTADSPAIARGQTELSIDQPPSAVTLPVESVQSSGKEESLPPREVNESPPIERTIPTIQVSLANSNHPPLDPASPPAPPPTHSMEAPVPAPLLGASQSPRDGSNVPAAPKHDSSAVMLRPTAAPKPVESDSSLAQARTPREPAIDVPAPALSDVGAIPTPLVATAPAPSAAAESKSEAAPVLVASPPVISRNASAVESVPAPTVESQRHTLAPASQTIGPESRSMIAAPVPLDSMATPEAVAAFTIAPPAPPRAANSSVSLPNNPQKLEVPSEASAKMLSASGQSPQVAIQSSPAHAPSAPPVQLAPQPSAAASVDSLSAAVKAQLSAKSAPEATIDAKIDPTSPDLKTIAVPATASSTALQLPAANQQPQTTEPAAAVTASAKISSNVVRSAVALNAPSTASPDVNIALAPATRPAIDSDASPLDTSSNQRSKAAAESILPVIAAGALLAANPPPVQALSSMHGPAELPGAPHADQSMGEAVAASLPIATTNTIRADARPQPTLGAKVEVAGTRLPPRNVVIAQNEQSFASGAQSVRDSSSPKPANEDSGAANRLGPVATLAPAVSASDLALPRDVSAAVGAAPKGEPAGTNAGLPTTATFAVRADSASLPSSGSKNSAGNVHLAPQRSSSDDDDHQFAVADQRARDSGAVQGATGSSQRSTDLDLHIEPAPAARLSQVALPGAQPAAHIALSAISTATGAAPIANAPVAHRASNSPPSGAASPASIPATVKLAPRDAKSNADESWILRTDQRIPDAPSKSSAGHAPTQSNSSALAGETPLLALDLHIPKDIAPPPAASPYVQRSEEVRKEVVKKMGGSEATEQAVNLALKWFAAHQSADGRWAAKGFDQQCHGCGGEAKYETDVASTALALLCFMAADHTHMKDGPYRDVVARGVAWLKSQQGQLGDWRGGETMYSHGIATIAMSEALGMTGDQSLAVPIKSAIDFIWGARNKRSGGWRYEPGQAGDTSVLGWQIMAITSAKRAGIPIPDDAYRMASEWLTIVATPGNPGLYSYQPGQQFSPSMTAEGMFVQQLAGLQRDDQRMRGSAECVLKNLPQWKHDPNTYYWYYATLAMFQHQGEPWKKWNAQLTAELLANQRTTGPAAGSWDPLDNWSRIGGRIYQTAMCTLCLEVYYRYLPMYKVVEQE